MHKNIQIIDLGESNYAEALQTQLHYFEKIKEIKLSNRDSGEQQPTPNFFLYVTHPHTYTQGKNGNFDNILLSEEQLTEKKIDFFHTNRGGDVTYHGPGQIVGYPILDLDNFQADIHLYVRDLEEVIIRTIAEFDLLGKRSEGETGVWLDVGTPRARKICAIGVHTSRWVTMHGFALNVNTDLSFFEGIIPCGIMHKGVTSLQKELNQFIDEKIIKEKIIKHFADVFGANIFINEI